MCNWCVCKIKVGKLKNTNVNVIRLKTFEKTT